MTKPKLISEYIHFRIYQEQKVNTSGQTETHEYVWRKDGTRIIGVTWDKKIVLNHEFRYEKNAFDWRVPGGRLDFEDEPLVEAAKREFRQETGYVAENWRFLWSSSPDSTVRYQRHFFLATGLELIGADRDPGEFGTETHLIELDEANRMALTGQIEEEISALAIARLLYENTLGD